MIPDFGDLAKDVLSFVAACGIFLESFFAATPEECPPPVAAGIVPSSVPDLNHGLHHVLLYDLHHDDQHHEKEHLYQTVSVPYHVYFSHRDIEHDDRYLKSESNNGFTIFDFERIKTILSSSMQLPTNN